jgi:tetratricopeptide (TPR) repeat protein
MYRELLKKDPQNAAVLSNLAITLSAAKKTADANAIYNQLLGRTDLSPTQLLNVGIGLNNSGDYAKAAEAFDRALKLNPYSHDVLDFRIHSLTGAVDEMAQKNAPAATVIAARNAVIEAGQKLLAIDPANAPVILAVADAQRQNSDADKANTDKYKKDVLATLTALDKLPYSVVGIRSDADDKSITLTGSVMGLEKSKGGSSGTIRFFVLDKDGKELGQKDVTVVVPVKEQMTPFSLTIDAPATAVAWKYQIIS